MRLPGASSTTTTPREPDCPIPPAWRRSRSPRSSADNCGAGCSAATADSVGITSDQRSDVEVDLHGGHRSEATCVTRSDRCDERSPHAGRGKRGNAGSRVRTAAKSCGASRRRRQGRSRTRPGRVRRQSPTEASMRTPANPCHTVGWNRRLLSIPYRRLGGTMAIWVNAAATLARPSRRSRCRAIER